MEIKILLPKGNSKQGVINLKNYIDRASIEGVVQSEVERASHYNGEMGAGAILGSISTVVEAAHKPLTELVKCLQKYVDNYRTEITIPTKNGNIVLSVGRSMKADKLKELVVSILESNS
jgi:hypothetical protein